MTIRKKVAVCLIAVLVLFAGATLFNYRRDHQSSLQMELIRELFLPLSRYTAELQHDVHNMAESLRNLDHWPEHSPERRIILRAITDVYPNLIRKRILSVKDLLARIDKNHVQSLADDLGNIFQMTSDFGNVPATYYGKIEERLSRFTDKLDLECKKLLFAAEKARTENLFRGLLFSLAVVLLSLVTMAWSYRVLRPLPQFIESVKKIADGDFHQSLKIGGNNNNEISLLAREYNRMLEALRERETKIKKQQDEILQSERLAAIGQLSAEIVHEIRNPLNSISLNIEWLDHKLQSTNPEIKKTLQSVSREIHRLNDITESYLLRARLPQQGATKTPLNELLNGMINFSQEEDKLRKVEIEKDLSADELFVRIDRSRLKQACLNVLRNARESMPNGGKILIRTRQHGNINEIQFSDNGHGMNETTRHQMLRPFFTTKTSGTGLGLTLSKTIIEQAQGSLLCDSQVGKGTTFYMRFPV